MIACPPCVTLDAFTPFTHTDHPLRQLNIYQMPVRAVRAMLPRVHVQGYDDVDDHGDDNDTDDDDHGDHGDDEEVDDSSV